MVCRMVVFSCVILAGHCFQSDFHFLEPSLLSEMHLGICATLSWKHLFWHDSCEIQTHALSEWRLGPPP